MKISLQKFDQLLAEQGRTPSNLRGVVAPATLAKIRKGQDVSKRTAGKLAAALGVRLAGLIECDPNRVVIDRIRLIPRLVARELSLTQLLILAGVRPFDAVEIHRDAPVSIGTAWRISDALGVLLDEII